MLSVFLFWRWFNYHYMNVEDFLILGLERREEKRPPLKKYRFVRKINEHTINDFLIKLGYENWETVFSPEDVNKMFNSFLDTYLQIFNSSFPLKRVKKKKKTWITLGILTSCKHKRELFIASRNSNNLDFKTYYRRYCKNSVCCNQES